VNYGRTGCRSGCAGGSRTKSHLIESRPWPKRCRPANASCVARGMNGPHPAENRRPGVLRNLMDVSQWGCEHAGPHLLRDRTRDGWTEPTVIALRPLRATVSAEVRHSRPESHEPACAMRLRGGSSPLAVREPRTAFAMRLRVGSLPLAAREPRTAFALGSHAGAATVSPA